MRAPLVGRGGRPPPPLRALVLMPLLMLMLMLILVLPASALITHGRLWREPLSGQKPLDAVRPLPSRLVCAALCLRSPDCTALVLAETLGADLGCQMYQQALLADATDPPPTGLTMKRENRTTAAPATTTAATAPQMTTTTPKADPTGSETAQPVTDPTADPKVTDPTATVTEPVSGPGDAKGTTTDAGAARETTTDPGVVNGLTTTDPGVVNGLTTTDPGAAKVATTVVSSTSEAAVTPMPTTATPNPDGAVGSTTSAGEPTTSAKAPLDPATTQAADGASTTEGPITSTMPYQTFAGCDGVGYIVSTVPEKASLTDDKCKQINAKAGLASIEGDSELELIQEKISGDTIIGLVRVSASTAWYWKNGDTSTYRKFGVGEEENKEPLKLYTYLSKGTGEFVAVSENDKMPFVCKIRLDPSNYYTSPSDDHETPYPAGG